MQLKNNTINQGNNAKVNAVTFYNDNLVSI